MKKGAFSTGIGSVAICLMVIVVLETFSVDFMTQNLLVGIAGFCFLLGVAAIVFSWFLSQKKMVGKVFTFIIFSLFVLFSIVGFVDIIAIYQDREAYENKDFSVKNGIPTDESFGDDGLITSFEIDGIDFSAINSSITKQEFAEKYKDQAIQVRYLPKSKIVINIDKMQNEE